MEKPKSFFKQGLRFVLDRFITPTTVKNIERISGSFLLIELQGSKLKEAKWKPGDKIQVDTGDFTYRTYTPISLDTNTGTLKMLCFLRASSPARDWLLSLKAGSVCEAFGPRNSLDTTAISGPMIVFGDETSIGFVKSIEGRGDSSLAFLEVGFLAESEKAVNAIGLQKTELLEKNTDGSHLNQIAERIREAYKTLSEPTIILTGRASSIQSIRSSLGKGGILPSAMKVRVYWADGKAGLD